MWRFDKMRLCWSHIYLVFFVWSRVYLILTFDLRFRYYMYLLNVNMLISKGNIMRADLWRAESEAMKLNFRERNEEQRWIDSST